MRALQRISLLLIILIINFPLWSDHLYDAQVLERNGEMEKAVGLYDSWLSENSNDPAFSDILFHCASLIVSADRSIAFLFKYEKVIDTEKKQNYYANLAQTYELMFQNKKAAIYYKKASIDQKGIFNYELYLKYLILEYQMGIIPETSVLNNILLSNITVPVYVDTLIFKSEILQYRGELNRAESLLQQSEYSEIFPELQLALWEIYLLQNNYSAISEVLKFMKSEFPRSIELSIMEGYVKKLPRLSDFFIHHDTPRLKSYVQVGSYADDQNIRIQSEELKRNGFDFFYIEENNLTKIIVVDIISDAQLLNTLQSKGFNGFKIDYP